MEKGKTVIYLYSELILSSENKQSRVLAQRRQWHPTPVLLPGKSHGQRSLVGCSPWGRQVRHNWATSLSLFTFMHWRRKWQPTPVFLPGESQGRKSLVGCHLLGHTESDTTEATQQQQQGTCFKMIMPKSNEHKNEGSRGILFNSIHSRYVHLGIYTKVK